ncbi:imidazole glycerol phosphate synthase subunit HisH [Candidatus Daviesbacteria bacterium]|nr:imidazole glycerol phosphate synthase subunit HisH [Candidatus Daviesbacteria bacterium]
MIVIIDYGLGNLASITNALNKLGIKSRISDSPDMIKKAKALILPGVGAAGEGMRNLKKKGLDKIILREIKEEKPLLGICLGMQLLFEKSEEGEVDCLGIFKGMVRKFKKERKIPQIGWNNVMLTDKQKLFQGVPNTTFFYFVNSYYCQPSDKSIVVGVTEYGERFASVIRKGNIVGMQFHPEKSGDLGLQLLKNFNEAIC